MQEMGASLCESLPTSSPRPSFLVKAQQSLDYWGAFLSQLDISTFITLHPHPIAARRLDYYSSSTAAPPPSSPLRSCWRFVTGDAPWVRGSDTDEDNYRPSKRSRADFRPPTTARNDEDTDAMQSSPGRSQRGHSREDERVTDQIDYEQYEDEMDEEGEFQMYRVQGTLREWVIRDEVRRFIAKKFKEFLLTYYKSNNDTRI